MDIDENNSMNSLEENQQYNPENNEQPAVVELIAPNGLGFGEGGISVTEQIRKGIITPEVPKHIHNLLLNDPNAFKSVEAPDDGCGDGRPWSKIIQLVADENNEKKIRLYKSSLLRAKVFGGGLVVASSMWRTINGVPADGETVLSDRAFMADELAKRNISHGAHSDDHAEGGNCGCGAIDKYPIISANAVKYRNEITGALRLLYGHSFDENASAIETAFATYESLANKPSYFLGANGKNSMEQILESGAVVKELHGHHVEETIVINDVRGTTLDQRYFTETVKNACSEGQKPQTIQAFSVDIWRGKEIARVVADIAHTQDPSADIDDLYKLAYADFLIRTLAVSGTLTAGDLPIYLRRPETTAV